MEYITIKRYHKKAICEELLDIPVGTKFNTIGEFIVTPDGRPICVTRSYSSHNHFARNDDGNGMRRGLLTYSICNKNRSSAEQNGSSWTPEEAQLIYDKYSHFLRPEHMDVMLWNNEFFHADIDELEQLTKDLNIIVVDKIEED